MATYKPLLPTAADKERGLTQGLLQLGQSLSASGGYSKMPTSFMSALGKGGAAFGQGYQSEIERAKKGQLQNLQYQQAQAQMQKTQMDIDAAKKQQAQEAQAQLVADRYVNSKTMGGGAAGGQMGPTVGAGAALSAMDPLQRARMQASPVAALQADIAAKVASDAATLDFQRQLQLKGADVPASYQAYKLSKFPGTFMEYQTQLKSAGKPVTNINTKGEGKEAEEYGKMIVEREGAVLDAGDQAGRTLQNLNMAKSVVGNVDVNPTAFGTTVGSVATSLGIALPENFEKSVTTGQAFNAQMGQILASKLAAQSGPQTDRDANRMAETMATLGNTPAARVFALDAAAAIANRDVQKANFYRQWRATNGTINGADMAWNKEVGNMPLFGSRDNGLPIFFDEFMAATATANPNISADELKSEAKKLWKQKYAK